MKTIRVNLKERGYDIVIGNDSLKKAGRIIKRLKLGRDAFVITNSLIKSKFAQPLNKTLKEANLSVKYQLIPDSEKSKSIKIALSILKQLNNYDKKRNLFIIALGGGVIGDVAGFIASIYKRGIPYVNIPTTLLSQIDSSIGGKTAVDLTEGKNLVGAFYQPNLVLSDISALKSLGQRELRSGLSEAIKYGIIKDRLLFEFLEKYHRDILRLDDKKIEFLVYRCSKIKAKIIEKDEKEKKGIRTILNFGHTIGHAIEAASGFKGITHGEAIAIGMVSATFLSEKLGMIKPPAYERIKKLISAAGLPVKTKNLPVSKIINAHYRDKKFIGGKNRFVLIKGIGKATVVSNIKLELIKQSITNA